jgi:hypothetical protein
VEYATGEVRTYPYPTTPTLIFLLAMMRMIQKPMRFKKKKDKLYNVLEVLKIYEYE